MPLRRDARRRRHPTASIPRRKRGSPRRAKHIWSCTRRALRSSSCCCGRKASAGSGRTSRFASHYDVGSDGTDFLTVWSEHDLYASVVSSAGVMAAPKRLHGFQDPLRLAWGGSRYVAIADGSNIETHEVSRAGELLTQRHPVARVVGRVHSIGGVAFNGRTSLFTWSHQRTGGSVSEVSGLIDAEP